MKVYLPFCLFLASLFLFQCKSLRNSQLDADVDKTVIGKAEIERVNGSLRQNRIAHSNPNVWKDYQTGQLPIDEEPYQRLWNLYQNFIIPDGERFKLKRYKVRFHITRSKYVAPEQAETEAPTEEYDGKTEDEVNEQIQKNQELILKERAEAPKREAIADKNQKKLSEAEFANESKTCKVNKDKSYRRLTYNLLNYRQPNAARNFLILAKLKYFDGKVLNPFIEGRFARLFVAGAHESIPEPFHFVPDPFYTDNDLSTSKDMFDSQERSPLGYSEGTADLRAKAATNYYNQAWKKFSSRTAYGALTAVVYNVAGMQTTRRLYTLKIGFSIYQNAEHEFIDFLPQRALYPIALGRALGTRRYQLDLKQMYVESDPNSENRYEYKIDCVEIYPPEYTTVKPLTEFPED